MFVSEHKTRYVYNRYNIGNYEDLKRAPQKVASLRQEKKNLIDKPLMYICRHNTDERLSAASV